MIKLKLFKIDTDELLGIWDTYLDTALEDKDAVSSEFLSALEQIVEALSSGEEFTLELDSPLDTLFENFVNGFKYDENTKEYKFQFMFHFAEGKGL